MGKMGQSYEDDGSDNYFTDYTLEYDQSQRASELENLPFHPGVNMACWLTQQLVKRIRFDRRFRAYEEYLRQGTIVDVDANANTSSDAINGPRGRVKKFVVVDYRDFVILAEETVSSTYVWDSFFTYWCRSGKPFTFAASMEPYMAQSAVNILLARVRERRKKERDS